VNSDVVASLFVTQPHRLNTLDIISWR